MASKIKTPLGLSQWGPDEEAEREDFNSDNVIIDKTCEELKNQTESLQGILEEGTDKYIVTNGAQAYGVYINPSNARFSLGSFTGNHLQMNINGLVLPSEDGVQDLGYGNARGRDVYAKTGTIQTSDEREKEDIFPLGRELAIEFLKALGDPCTYKYRDGKRTHWGYTAQQVKQAMDKTGLNDMDFAGWTKAGVSIDNDEGKETDVQGLRPDELSAVLFSVILSIIDRLDQIQRRI